MKSIRNTAATWLAALAAVTSWALLSASPAHATSVLPLYLDEVIDHSTTAFEGTVADTHSARDTATNLVVTYTTFTVTDVLKGTVPSTYTIKQIGGELPQEDLIYHVPGIPKFKLGEDYVVFMAGVSRSGFSSPIGLAQGRFNVMQGPAGRVVGNGRDLREITTRMGAQLPAQSKALQAATGPVHTMDLENFKQLVRNHVAARQNPLGAKQ